MCQDIDSNSDGTCSRVTIVLLCSIGGLLALLSAFGSIFLLVNYVPYEIGDDKIALHILNSILNLYLIILCIIGCIINCSLTGNSSRWFLIISLINFLLLFIFSLAIDLPYGLGHTKKSLIKDFDRLIKVSNVSETDHLIQTLDHIQQFFDCCGIDGINDYTNRTLPIPVSCGKSTRGCVNQLVNFEFGVRACTTLNLLIWFGIVVFGICRFYYYYGDSEELSYQPTTTTTAAEQTQTIKVVKQQGVVQQLEVTKPTEQILPIKVIEQSPIKKKKEITETSTSTKQQQPGKPEEHITMITDTSIKNIDI